MPQKWLTITPESSFLEVDAEIEVQLQVVIQDKNVEDNLQLSCILVIRLDQGRDYFVVVSAVYKRTITEKEPETEKIVTAYKNNQNNKNTKSNDDWLIKFD